MQEHDKDGQLYREIIDRLVDSCLRGQGQLARRKVLEGVWHRYVEDLAGPDTPDWMRESEEALAAQMRTVNEVLAQFDQRAREVVAWLLDQQYVAGVHDTLVQLYEAEIAPFDKGYWDPFHDFVGRLDDWEWPLDERRV